MDPCLFGENMIDTQKYDNHQQENDDNGLISFFMDLHTVR
jgi:hypothetical protein